MIISTVAHLSSTASLTSSPSSSSSSESAISRSTTPSSVPVGKTRSILLLPSARFLDVTILQSLAETDEENPTFLWFILGAAAGTEPVLEKLVRDLGASVGIDGDVCLATWTAVQCDIAGCGARYYISSESDEEHGHSACTFPCISSCDSSTSLPTHAETLNVFSQAGLRAVVCVALPCPHAGAADTATMTVAEGYGRLYLLEKPAISFPQLSRNGVSPFGVPSMSEWRTLWDTWDRITLGMIPRRMLLQKPIDLRHQCLFYLGHLPTFLDILLSKRLNEQGTEPRSFRTIFERGIDPHVDDPDHCHNHSVVPEADEDWPTLESILGFRDRVRARVERVYAEVNAGQRVFDRGLARTLMMCLEHEGWHIETLLYMLIQRAGTGMLPPPGTLSPPWEVLAKQWNEAAAAFAKTPGDGTVVVGPADVVLGHDDSEADDVAGLTFPAAHELGWDNESPRRLVRVGRIRVSWRCVTNGEFMQFWAGEGKGAVGMPSSWVVQDGQVKVRTLYGPVAMDVARHWPVLACYDDLLVYARTSGGRLPQEAELRHFLDLYDVGHDGGANVAFRNWHPMPGTMGSGVNGGRGHNGGVWEWTSTLFEGHEGMVPTKIFPGYSTDFFDGKHHIVLGASYATIPRLAGRRTVRNFWQHNYPYAWVAGRVVYDG